MRGSRTSGATGLSCATAASTPTRGSAAGFWTRTRGRKKRDGAWRERRKSDVAVIRFGFNGWARYPDFRKDARVTGKLARALGLPSIPATAAGREIVLEGGAIDVNGTGTLVTTEECLLDREVQVRN